MNLFWCVTILISNLVLELRNVNSRNNSGDFIEIHEKRGAILKPVTSYVYCLVLSVIKEKSLSKKTKHKRSWIKGQALKCWEGVDASFQSKFVQTKPLSTSGAIFMSIWLTYYIIPNTNIAIYSEKWQADEWQWRAQSLFIRWGVRCIVYKEGGGSYFYCQASLVVHNLIV